MASFETLFSPFPVANLRLKNRILMAAMGNNFSHGDGTVSDRAIAYYAARARGGAGLIITETSPVNLSGRHRTRGICAYDDSFLPGLRRLADAVHGEGGAMALQLHHAGRLADPDISGGPALAPSPIARTRGGPVPKEMSLEEIGKTIADFASAARRAQRAGFDAVEVHGAHGYLIHQFFSPRLNRRKDVYGGSSENRGRLALEVLRRVRKEVGEAFPVIFRLSAQEYVEGGYLLEEAVDWAVEAERAGASALHVSGGTTESLAGSARVIPPMVFPEGFHLPLAAAIKQRVRIPVIAVGRLGSPEVAEQVLREGAADLVAAGRAFLCDPDWPRKALQGEADRIRPCVACNHCIWRLFQQEDLTCFQNALLGNEYRYRLDPAEKAKRVLVIGGGPGGLEAARVARKRGHRVTLWEKSSSLGGQMRLASIPPHKQTFRRALDWLIREVEREGIEVRLSTEGDSSNIPGEKADGVILAAGARPIFPETFCGPKVMTAWEVLAGKETGKEVLILGGGMVGMETAEFLSSKGCRVTVVEMLPKPAADMEGTTRALLLERLPASGIEVKLSTKVEQVRGGLVWVEGEGGKVCLEAETIVLALGAQANKEIRQALEGKVSPLLPVGDCLEPRRAREAIHEGFAAAMII
jgi:2,4-dienoyl-CoA reductase-like NADH-dependent reductase (Old Yellow Enzyme family)/thioredoxin reductase